MKKLISILSILFIASNIFAQVNTGKKIIIKTGGGGISQHYIDSLLATGYYTIDQINSIVVQLQTDSIHPYLLKKNEKIDTSNLPITNIHTGRGVGHSNDSTLITQAHVYSQSSVATLTINADTTDMAVLTTQAVGLTIANPTGTLLDGQRLIIRIYTSSVQTIGFGTKFRFGSNSPAPTATLSTSTMYMEFIYNSDDDTLDMLNPYNTF